MKATDLTIIRADLGWIVTCRVCGWEAFAERRPGADRVASDPPKDAWGEGAMRAQKPLGMGVSCDNGCTALTANKAARATAAKRSPGLDRTTVWSDSI